MYSNPVVFQDSPPLPPLHPYHWYQVVWNMMWTSPITKHGELGWFRLLWRTTPATYGHYHDSKALVLADLCGVFACDRRVMWWLFFLAAQCFPKALWSTNRPRFHHMTKIDRRSLLQSVLVTSPLLLLGSHVFFIRLRSLRKKIPKRSPASSFGCFLLMTVNWKLWNLLGAFCSAKRNSWSFLLKCCLTPKGLKEHFNHSKKNPSILVHSRDFLLNNWCLFLLL